MIILLMENWLAGRQDFQQAERHQERCRGLRGRQVEDPIQGQFRRELPELQELQELQELPELLGRFRVLLVM